MDDNLGRAAIIENGSPLSSGGVASGESQIRRWMLESDLIEAIIALPTDLFITPALLHISGSSPRTSAGAQGQKRREDDPAGARTRDREARKPDAQGAHMMEYEYAAVLRDEIIRLRAEAEKK